MSEVEVIAEVVDRGLWLAQLRQLGDVGGVIAKDATQGLARFGPSSSGAFSGNRFPQQKVFQDELPFAGNEWSTANIACYFEIDRLWPRFSFDDLVQRFAAWAAEKRRWVRTRHEHAAPTD
jgi:hypothetical protein